MDSLLENLSRFEVTSHPNNPNAEHPHFSLYKHKSTGSSQEERRRQILEARKESRYDLMKHLRQIEEEGEYEESNEINDNEMDYLENPKAVYARPRRYNNFVMLSEWLIEIPENFEEKYVALPCPVGKRCLVVCYKGWTSAYLKNGARLKLFPSALPGGSRKTKKKGYTVLDCIFSESNKSFFIIDLIYWNRSSYLDCDTDFRFNWLQSTIREWDEDVSQITESNPYRFIPIPNFGCSRSSLEQMLGYNLPYNVDLDGVLFYHKDSHYTHGPSPLICWLKAFMFPEMLSVTVPQKYLLDRPSHYTNMAVHIEEYEKEREEKLAASARKFKHKNQQHDTKAQMEVSPTAPEECSVE